MISAVILAAGLASRMGQQKLLLKLGAKSIIEHTVEHVLASEVDEVIVVLGSERERIAKLLAKYPVKTVYNPDYAAGQGTSVAVGAATVSPSSSAILYILGDQPLISAEVMNQLIAQFKSQSVQIVRPQGTGNPTIFNIKLKDELRNCSGDIGGRQLLEKYQSDVVIVPIVPAPITLDVDTMEDYQRMLQLWKQ